ncbi:MAG TPA: hypothetical protein VNG12_17025, partial [Acidimicrobiales bacterium]|nr:hypothetical protein [Acidimicrobiales bacterium]
KLDRAKEHWGALNREIRSFLGDHAIGPAATYDPLQRLYIFRIGTVEPLPVRWGIVVGDIVHNTRSALDHLVTQLVIANGHRPGRHHAFPVCLTLSDWRRQVEQAKPGKAALDGVAPGAVSLIQSIQPYQTGVEEDAGRSTIAGLQRLWNTDKHQLVHCVRSFIADHEPQIALDPGPPIAEVVWAKYCPGAEIVDGAEIARAQLRLHPLAITPSVAVSLKMRIMVGFQGKPDEPLASMKFLDHTIDQARAFVDRCARLG